MENMARRTLLSSGVLSFGLLTMKDLRAQGGGVWLVTSQEAALPRSSTSKAGRSITRGPAIRQISPLNAVAPKAYEVIMNTAFEMFPDSAAAKGDRKALRGAGAQATNEQIAFAALMRGVHW